MRSCCGPVGGLLSLGQVTGSSQIGNREIVATVLQRLYEDPSRPIASSIFDALADVQAWAGSDHYAVRLTAQGYNMLGNPISRFSPSNYSIVSAPALDEPRAWDGLMLSIAPNPASGGSVSASVDVRVAGALVADVFDVSGRRVRRLVESEWIDAGSHVLRWDGLSENGLRVAPGVYWVSVNVGQAHATERLTIVR